jgi:hypothetical protein
MNIPPAKNYGRSWRLPLLFSLGLHALLGLALVWGPGLKGQSSEAPAGVDVVCLEEENAGTITFVETKPQPQGIQKTAPISVQEDDPDSSARVEEVKPFVDPVENSSVGHLPNRKRPGSEGTEESEATGGNTGSGNKDSVASGPGRGKGIFPFAESGKSVVYVIDRSISMGLNHGLETAKREVLKGLGQLPEKARFQVIFYNKRPEPLRIQGTIDLLPATDTVKRQAAILVEVEKAQGGTDHLQGLREAFGLHPDLIVLVTDADDMSLEMVDKITRMNKNHCTIHSIELTSHRDNLERSTLRKIAEQNSGTYQVLSLKGDNANREP